MSDAQVLVFGEGRKRHTLDLPFRCAPGTRDVFLCANAERAGQLARAAAQGDAAMVASAGWESKARIREARACFLKVWPDGDDCHHDHARAGFRRLHA